MRRIVEQRLDEVRQQPETLGDHAGVRQQPQAAVRPADSETTWQRYLNSC
jgi:hypothetical protein